MSCRAEKLIRPSHISLAPVLYRLEIKRDFCVRVCGFTLSLLSVMRLPLILTNDQSFQDRHALLCCDNLRHGPTTCTHLPVGKTIHAILRSLVVDIHRIYTHLGLAKYHSVIAEFTSISRTYRLVCLEMSTDKFLYCQSLPSALPLILANNNFGIVTPTRHGLV